MHPPFRIVIYNTFAKLDIQGCMFFLEGLLGAIIRQKVATSSAKVGKNGAKQAQGQPQSGARAPFLRPRGAQKAPKRRQSGAKAAPQRNFGAHVALLWHFWASGRPKPPKIIAF